MSQVKYILAVALILAGCSRGRAKEKEVHQVQAPPATMDPAPAEQRGGRDHSSPPGIRPQPMLPIDPREKVPTIRPEVDPLPPTPGINSGRTPPMIRPEVVPGRRSEDRPRSKTMYADHFENGGCFDDSPEGRAVYIKNVLQAVGLSLEDVEELSFTRVTEGLDELALNQFHQSRVPGMRWALLENKLLVLHWNPFEEQGGFVSSRVLSPEEMEILEWQLTTAAGQATASFVRCLP